LAYRSRVNQADFPPDILRSFLHDAFGRIVDNQGDFELVFGFAGGLNDPLTGLVRFGARDYDPETGRWTAKDPIGFAGGDPNLYGYVLGDPVNGVDPEGNRYVDENICLGYLNLGLQYDPDAFEFYFYFGGNRTPSLSASLSYSVNSAGGGVFLTNQVGGGAFGQMGVDLISGEFVIEAGVSTPQSGQSLIVVLPRMPHQSPKTIGEAMWQRKSW
jgi:RHS repeat-associated protein